MKKLPKDNGKEQERILKAMIVLLINKLTKGRHGKLENIQNNEHAVCSPGMSLLQGAVYAK